MLLDMKGYDNNCDVQDSDDIPGQTECLPAFDIAQAGNSGQGTKGDQSLEDDNGNLTHIAIDLRASNSEEHSTGDLKSRNSSESLISEEGAEGWKRMTLQICIPLFFAGLGMVFAGKILDVVKEWPVFQGVPELLVMVTPLLGLKGNLEMTLASRLSTHSNLGSMDTFKNLWYISTGNLVLIQVQANVVGFLTSIVAVGLGFAVNGVFDLDHAFLLCASSMLTASICSWIIGIIMTAVVISAQKFNCNPDNIACPIAASFGDVTTLGLLAYLASFLYEVMASLPWVSPLVIIACSMVLPVWIWIANKNIYTKNILRNGWLPVIVAMMFSGLSGVVLDLAEGHYPRIALFQPVINGVGGNLVSVQASRLSTYLHKHCEPGKLPRRQSEPGQKDVEERCVDIWLTPWSVFAKQGVHSLSARILLLIVIPGQAVFFMMSFAMSGVTDVTQLSIEFFVAYLVAAVLQVMILLYIAQVMIHWFWSRKIDPDTNTIPYLTSLGDLIGTAFLFLAFHILYGSGT